MIRWRFSQLNYKVQCKAAIFLRADHSVKLTMYTRLERIHPSCRMSGTARSPRSTRCLLGGGGFPRLSSPLECLGLSVFYIRHHRSAGTTAGCVRPPSFGPCLRLLTSPYLPYLPFSPHAISTRRYSTLLFSTLRDATPRHATQGPQELLRQQRRGRVLQQTLSLRVAGCLLLGQRQGQR